MLQDMDYEAVLILATLRESQAERLQQNPPPTVIRGPGSGPLLGQAPVVAGGRTPQIPGDTPAARSSAQGMIPSRTMFFLHEQTPCSIARCWISGSNTYDIMSCLGQQILAESLISVDRRTFAHIPYRSNAPVERTLSWLTLKAGLLTLKVERNPKLYYSVLGMFDQCVRPVRECHLCSFHGR